MKLRPDQSPLVDLSAHRTPREYEQSSVLRELGKFTLLVAFGAALVGGYLWLIFNAKL